ncbi:MAG: OmpH family outer membrane protein [Thermodesulfovibrionales bacterium]
MKKAFVVVVAFVLLTSAAAMAQEGLKIGYVNMRKALNECVAGKGAKDNLEKTIKDRQALLDEEKKKLEGLQEDFEKKAALLSDKAKQEKQKEFQEKVQAYQKMVADAQKELNEKEAAATKSIIEGLRSVIAEFAAKEGYTLVFEETEISVLYAKEGLDLTDRVIKLYDEKAAK